MKKIFIPLLMVVLLILFMTSCNNYKNAVGTYEGYIPIETSVGNDLVRKQIYMQVKIIEISDTELKCKIDVPEEGDNSYSPWTTEEKTVSFNPDLGEINILSGITLKYDAKNNSLKGNFCELKRIS